MTAVSLLLYLTLTRCCNNLPHHDQTNIFIKCFMNVHQRF